MLANFDPPTKFLTDRGSQFTADFFQSNCKNHGIRQIFTSPQNPQGNGITERNNGSILPIIRINRTKVALDEIIKMCERKLNSTYHRILKCTPFEIIFGYNQIDPFKSHNVVLRDINLTLKKQLKLTDKKLIRIEKNLISSWAWKYM